MASSERAPTDRFISDTNQVKRASREVIVWVALTSATWWGFDSGG